MNIAQRNFFRLLRAGIFGDEEQVEPMSAWKWQQLLKWARQQQLVPLVYDGLCRCRHQFFLQLPQQQLDTWKEQTEGHEAKQDKAEGEVAELLLTLGQLQLRPILLDPWPAISLYDKPSHHGPATVNIFFPFATQGNKADEWARANGNHVDTPRKQLMRYEWKGLSVEHRHQMLHLNNKFNNSTLQAIVDQEWLEGGTAHTVIGGQRIETVGPTLYFLATLLSIVRTTLAQGLPLCQLADLGMLLRKQGHLVDFVKLQEWIDRLHFTRMAQLAGTVLIRLLGFTADEVPFMLEPSADNDADSLADNLLATGSRGSTAKYLRYCPGESLSSVVASITHSLGNIEE